MLAKLCSILILAVAICSTQGEKKWVGNYIASYIDKYESCEKLISSYYNNIVVVFI